MKIRIVSAIYLSILCDETLVDANGSDLSWEHVAFTEQSASVLQHIFGIGFSHIDNFGSSHCIYEKLFSESLLGMSTLNWLC